MNHRLNLLFLSLILLSCNHPINTVGDSHFTVDGYCLDTLKTNFKAEMPSSLNFFVEVSGSMNGFFRANLATKFKKDVWSIVSNFGNQDVFILSNEGIISEKCTIQQFKLKMNYGNFISNKETHIPIMLNTVLSNLDYNNGECAVLISDMKYSPEQQQDINALLIEYETDIRNVIAKYPSVALSLIMAKSDFLSNKGTIISESSPYYYLIIGKDANVACIRNCIATILEDYEDYGDCIEAGFDYKSPIYSFGIPNNAIQLYDEPTFINYDAQYSDTCKIKLNIDLSNYRWVITNEEVFRDSFKLKTCYGSDVKLGQVEINIDNHFDKQLQRKAIANVELLISNMIMTDSDVIEWILNQPESSITQDFENMIYASQENDYYGSFSVDRFIKGVFSATQNHWDTTPNRILISKTK